MRSYLSLIPISAKVRRRQNRMTLLCIIFAVFMVTAVFSMAEMGAKMEQARLAAKHDGFSFQNLFDSQMGQTLLLTAVVLFLLILIAGVLMIASSINNSVAQRIKFFGMMRCIGMSKQEQKIREVLETKLEKYIQPNINPRYNLAAGRSWDVFPTELDRCTVDKYALATDHGGQVFYSQAVENQKELFVGEAASALKKNIKQMEEGHQKGEEYQNEEQKADEEYQRAQAAQMEEKKRQESEKENAEKQEESDTDIKETEAVQAKVENPLDQIKKIKSMGILGLVLKDGTVVSDKTIERKNLPSERNLQKGSLLVNEISADPVSEAIFLNYLQKHFQCAVDEGGKHQKGSKEHSLSYELEYIIGGQKSDRENLKKTVNRILLIREGMNYATLAKSAKMRGEAMALAAAITGAAALPEFAGALCWCVKRGLTRQACHLCRI